MVAQWGIIEANAENLSPSDNLKLKRGTQILYVPMHAEGDINHPDCEAGFVTSISQDGQYAWCRYWGKYGGKLYLRTKSCSEKTEVADLVVIKTVDQKKVDDALERWCK